MKAALFEWELRKSTALKINFLLPNSNFLSIAFTGLIYWHILHLEGGNGVNIAWKKQLLPTLHKEQHLFLPDKLHVLWNHGGSYKGYDFWNMVPNSLVKL